MPEPGIIWPAELVQLASQRLCHRPGVLAVETIKFPPDDLRRHQQSDQAGRGELARQLWKFNAAGAAFRTTHGTSQQSAFAVKQVQQTPGPEILIGGNFQMDRRQWFRHEPDALDPRLVLNHRGKTSLLKTPLEFLRRFQFVERRQQHRVHIPT